MFDFGLTVGLTLALGLRLGLTFKLASLLGVVGFFFFSSPVAILQ